MEIVAFSLFLFTVLMCFGLVYINVNKDKELSKFLNEGRFGYYFSTMIYFIICLFTLCLACFLLLATPDTNPLGFRDLYYIIVLMVGVKISKGLYRAIYFLLCKMNSKYRLYFTGENNRTWCLLIAFLLLLIYAYSDETLKEMRNIAFSVIIGKFYWIENKKKNTLKLIKSFFLLPHDVCASFIVLIYLFILYLRKISIKVIVLSTFIGVGIYNIIIFIAWCINEIKKMMKEENDKDKN